MLEPVTNRNAMFTRQQAVVNRLREMIMKGELAGGDRMLEVALSEELSVSRTPIREALIVLAEDGLVEYRPNRGYVVRSFTLPFIMDAYIVREALEGLACRLAAEKGINEATRDAMEGLLLEGDRLLGGDRLSPSSRKPWGEVNDRLHNLILASAQSEPLMMALNAATTIPYASSRVVHWFEENDVEGLFQLRTVHAQHHAIVRAICAGEGYRAESVMRGHLSYAADHIRAKFLADESAREEAAAPVEKPEPSRPQLVSVLEPEAPRAVRPKAKSPVDGVAAKRPARISRKR
jgi:GntR family transcriptional regulator of vanillate catabolism